MGSSCLIFSLHFSDQGLYIALPRFDIMLPRSTAELVKFEKTMVDLLTFRHEVSKSVNFVMEQYSGNKHLKSLNQPKEQMTLTTTQDSSLHRDTWCTPPRGTSSRKPARLVSAVPQSLNTKLLSIACEESMASLQRKTADVNLVADEFGWVFDRKVWRNLKLGVSTPDNPYEDDA
ncbi:hypothetical protein INT45_009703 [Circinella minor]|uniref:Uncharacterized protein n=1 Tax=Circinella minor TaxID=1195481 RepID=A0A8H7R9P5_9FUNG|nr:hypothetical protein INT45_009703 [Circinella minor]